MMRDKPQIIAFYAAGASLAAITLYYILGPSIFPDDDLSFNHKGTAGAVGLSNPANDCFINSVLQAFAGLEELRYFLKQEVVLRELERSEGSGPSEDLYQVDPKDLTVEEGLELGVVTTALKSILDGLCDRPKYKRTISAKDFIRSLEYAFQKGLSRRQQDAQEFLQLVAERVCDEHHLHVKVRHNISSNGSTLTSQHATDGLNHIGLDRNTNDESQRGRLMSFPFEGQLSSQIECQTCHYTPPASVSTFVTLTLNVPQLPSASLDGCLDNLLKIETISDFKCDRCLLIAALAAQQRDHEKHSSSTDSVGSASGLIAELEAALAGGDLSSNSNEALIITISTQITPPKRTISKHTRISAYPKTLCLHLSRSIYDPSSFSTKNTAKVVFKESLTLGGLAEQRSYRLLCLVTHRGGHNSGHYETFRRQTSNFDNLPRLDGQNGREAQDSPPSDDSAARKREKRRKMKQQDRWWRISDDRIGDCRTADVLEMQREAYLLFYGQV